jgi:Rps23 Pro-64 3,4-dihydroxylase Tpa1-like proline 4-hydroxylase
MTEIKINSTLDPHALNQQLHESGRIQVPDFFEAATAEYLYSLLQKNTDWYVTYNEGGENYESTLTEFQSMAPPQRRQFLNRVFASARDGFQFIFRQYYISRAVENGENDGHPLHALHHYVNSDTFLDFMRVLTGSDEISKSDSYASLYAPGDFLTTHEDLHSTHDRLAAYVVSMTKDWNPNWGGYLAFYDDDDNIREAFMPTFNTLNLFLIPQKHAVQQVAPFAGHMRTSFLGWLQR